MRWRPRGDRVRRAPPLPLQSGAQSGAETLLESQEQDTEGALWAAARLMDDRSSLLDRLEWRAAARGESGFAGHYRRRADEASGHAIALRRLAEDTGREVTEDSGDSPETVAGREGSVFG